MNASLQEALFAFRRKLAEVLKKEAESLKCPMSQIETLKYIASKGDPTMKDIASHLKITPPSATTLVESMLKKKLITRITNKKDRRTIRISLTPTAWKLFKSLHDRKFTILTKMLSKLNESEKTQLIKIINTLITD